MQLIYLWVAEYKNIKNQGFNFSLDFKCEYDEKSNKLTIDENKNYPSIFPSNINVTAIVGENGSGKSSVLFQELNQNHGFSSGLKIIYNKKNRKLEIHEPYRVSHNDSPYLEICKIENKTDITIEKKTVFDDIDLDLFQKQDLSQPIGDSLDKEYSLYFDWDILNYFDLENFLQQSMHNTVKTKPNELIRFIQSEKDNELIDYKLFYDKIIEKIILNYKQFPFEKYGFVPYILSITYEEISSNIEELRNRFGSNKGHNFFEIHIKDFFENVDNLELEITNLEINIYNEKQYTIFELSHGERARFLMFFIMYIQIKDKLKDYNSLIVYLDEPDLMLHPNWQKQVIQNLITLFTDNNIHFILTTHSPFLLSDLPKENIIFLKKGKQVYPDIETFGANIHTLLSHGFFMDNGLMGEFAKSQIDDVINYLNNKKSDIKDNDKAQNIINLIGEPIIKRQLQKMLDSHRLREMEARLTKLEDNR